MKRKYIYRQFKEGEELCTTCSTLLIPGLLKDNPHSNISPSSMAKFNFCCRACTLVKSRKARIAKAQLDKELDVLRKDMRAYAKENSLTRLELREAHAKLQAERYAVQQAKAKKRFGKNYMPPRPGLPESFKHHVHKQNEVRLNRRRLDEQGVLDATLRRELQTLERENNENTESTPPCITT